MAPTSDMLSVSSSSILHHTHVLCTPALFNSHSTQRKCSYSRYTLYSCNKIWQYCLSCLTGKRNRGTNMQPTTSDLPAAPQLPQLHVSKITFHLFFFLPWYSWMHLVICFNVPLIEHSWHYKGSIQEQSAFINTTVWLVCTADMSMMRPWFLCSK